MATATDSFTGTNGTLLTAHVADTGQSWINGGGAYTGNLQLNGSGGIVSPNGNDDWNYLNVTPASADYSVFCTTQGASYAGGPVGRADATLDTRYVVMYLAGGSNEWRLYRYNNGVQSSPLGTYAGDAPTTAKAVELRMTGTTIAVFIGGVQRISVTDSSITAAGFPGVYNLGFSDTQTLWSATNMSGGASTATVTPSQATVTLSGLASSSNTFTNVRIREVLVNEAGSPVANQSGIHLLVWYNGFPASAPDLSYSDMTTDPNGTTSWSLATGTLIYNQRIFYVAHDGHTSLSVYTCAQMQPTYS